MFFIVYAAYGVHLGHGKTFCREKPGLRAKRIEFEPCTLGTSEAVLRFVIFIFEAFKIILYNLNILCEIVRRSCILIYFLKINHNK
jgi:hypothetical protein